MGVNTTNLDLYKPGDTETYNVDRDLNENWDKLDPLGVRYVTSKGVSGDWTWYKYSDGTVEAFAILKVSTPASWNVWGNSWYTQTLINIPTTLGLTSNPVILSNISGADDAFGLTQACNVTTSKFDLVIYRLKAASGTQTYTVSVHVIGKTTV